jgi:proteasome activator subunit 2 (PA28 beta)
MTVRMLRMQVRFILDRRNLDNFFLILLIQLIPLNMEGQTTEQEPLIQQVEKLRDNIAENAAEIIKKKIPAKILHLSSLFKAAAFTTPLEVCNSLELSDLKRKSEEGSAELSSKKIKVEGNTISVPSNQSLVGLTNIVKKEVLEAIDYLNTVKIWIQLNIPRIEAGNNFGVGIQEETILELSRVEDAGYSLLESMTKYFVTRGKLVSKVFYKTTKLACF